MRIVCLAITCFAMAMGQASGASSWTDEVSGLRWTTSDSGAPLTYLQAVSYCKSLALDDRKDWRLPTIDELQKLFGGPANSDGFHVRGPLKLTGWQWSSTPGKEKGEAWGLDFGDGGRASLVMGDSGLNRAMCVR